MIYSKFLFVSGSLLLALVSVLQAKPSKEQEKFNLFLDGKSHAAIVVDARPTRSAQLAICELVWHLEKITGERLPVVKSGEPLPKGAKPIYVGESPESRKLGLVASNFNPQQSLVRITPGYIALIGRDEPDTGEISYEVNGAWPTFNVREPFYDLGTLYAVYDFLEDQLGVRWYMVTEVGTSIPKARTLSFSPTERIKEPWAKYRHTSRNTWQVPGEIPELTKNPTLVPIRDSVLFVLRSRLGGAVYAVNHSFYHYYKRFGDQHPEWFVGKPGLDIQLKYHNEALQNQILSDANEFFRLSPAERRIGKRQQISRGDYFPLVPMDNRDYGPEAEPLLQRNRKDPGNFGTGIASNYIFSFVNSVAAKLGETNPDYWVSTIAYAAMFEPPEFELRPNVAVTVCMADGWDGYGMETLKAWREKVSRLLVWEYLFEPFEKIPSVQPVGIGNYIAQLREMGVYGWFSEMPQIPHKDGHRNPAMYHLNAYVMFRMLRDRDAKPETILKEYYRDFYGPAEVPMKNFWTTLFNVSEALAPKGIQAWTEENLAQALKTMETDLAQAEALAQKREPYATRLRYLKVGIIDVLTEKREHYSRVFSTPNRQIVAAKVEDNSGFLNSEDKAVWMKFSKTDVFGRLDGSKADANTVAYVGQEGDDICIAIECEEPYMEKIVANQTSSSGSLCTDDSVEVMLGRDGSRPDSYLHIMVNTRGLLWCRWTKKWTMEDLSGEKFKELGIRHKVELEKDRFIVKLVIPKRLFSEEKGDLRLAMHRNRVTMGTGTPGNITGERLLTWNPTFRWGFNEPSRFGYLVLSEDQSKQ